VEVYNGGVIAEATEEPLLMKAGSRNRAVHRFRGPFFGSFFPARMNPFGRGQAKKNRQNPDLQHYLELSSHKIALDSVTQKHHSVHRKALQETAKKKAMEKTLHHGHAIRRLREVMGLKQQALACGLGRGWTQRRVSLLEQKEKVAPPLLEAVAKALHIKASTICNFDEACVMEMIQHSCARTTAALEQRQPPPVPSINFLAKWLDLLEENKKLYERLIALEQEKAALLQLRINNCRPACAPAHTA
jgi:transcriptional regulator with XRE-family HTH domain